MHRDETISITFTLCDSGAPRGKVADAAIYWTDGPFAGLQLQGFAIWQRAAGGRNVTMPARQYSVNGERRSFALLRPQPLATASVQDAFRDWILDEYRHYEQSMAILADEAARAARPTPPPFYTETITHDTTTPETMEQRIDRTRAAAYAGRPPVQSLDDVKRYDNPDDAAAAAKRGEPICISDLIKGTTPARYKTENEARHAAHHDQPATIGPRADGIRF